MAKPKTPNGNDKTTVELDVSSQLKAMKDLQLAVESVTAALKDMSKPLSEQVSAFSALASKNVDGLSTSLSNATKEAEKTVTSTNKLSKTFQGVEKNLKKVSVAGAALSGLKKGFTNLLGVSASLGKFIFGLAGSFARLGLSLLSLPLAPIRMMLDAAANAPSMSEYAQALEDVRKAFGDLKGPTSSTIIGVAQDMKGFGDTGLGVFRVFGNVAQRIQEVNKLAQEMGPTFMMLMKDFQGAEGHAFAFMKGLGLTGEEMSSIELLAKSTGQSSSNVFRDMTKQAYGLARAFGEQGKVLSRDVAKGLKDVKHFAGATVKEIAQASVYSRKLGLELDKIVGVMDAFDTFDTASENVARLTQAFGLNLDTLDLMSAKTPTDQIEMLRKSMAAAGQSAESMDRYQLRLLASTVNLTEEQARAAFSLKNQGLSMDEIKKKGDELGKKQLSEAESMQVLSSSIERLVQEMHSQSSSFFQEFIRGIGVGMQQTKEFREAIMSIKRALFGAFTEGVKFGRFIVESMPGLKDMIVGIGKMFDPTRVTNFFAKVREALGSFMKGSSTFEQALDRIKGSMSDFLNASSPAGRQYLAGFKKFFGFMAQAAADGIKYLARELVTGMQGVGDIISGRKKVAGLEEGGSFVANKVVSPIFGALKDAAKKLIPAAFSLMGDVLNAIKSYLKDNWPAIQKWATEQFTEIKKFFDDPAVRRAILEGLIALKSTAWEGIKTLLSAMWENKDLAVPALLITLAPVGANIAQAIVSNVAGELAKKGLQKVLSGFAAEAGGAAAGVAGSAAKEAVKDVTKGVAEKVAEGAAGAGTAAAGGAATVGAAITTAGLAAAAATVGSILAAAGSVAVAYDQWKKLQAEGGFGEALDIFTGKSKIAKATQITQAQLDAAKTAIPTPEKSKEGLDFVGPVTLENATSKLTALEELSKKINTAGFDIKKMVSDIKAKFADADFDFFGPTKLEQLKSSEQGMGYISSFVESSTKAVEGMQKLTAWGAIPAISKSFKDSLMNFLDKLSEVKHEVYTKISKGMADSFGIAAENLKPINDFVSGVADMVGKVSESVSKLTQIAPGSITAAFKRVDDALQQIVWLSMSPSLGQESINSLTAAKTNIDVGVMNALGAVDAAIDRVNEINKKLGSNPTVNIGAKLTALATGLGLPNQVQQKIHGGEVNITVNLDVHMDVSETEKVLIMRSKSYIRDRLNYLTDNVPPPAGQSRPLKIEKTQAAGPPQTINKADFGI